MSTTKISGGPLLKPKTKSESQSHAFLLQFPLKEVLNCWGSVMVFFFHERGILIGLVMFGHPYIDLSLPLTNYRQQIHSATVHQLPNPTKSIENNLAEACTIGPTISEERFAHLHVPAIFHYMVKISTPNNKHDVASVTGQYCSYLFTASKQRTNYSTPL